MSQKTDLNISPYYDDFSESKNFHKVLFRAGRPVQARELTQSQSLLQNQVQRFGDHMFKEGSIVNGAATDIDMDVEFVKVDATNPNSAGTADVSSYIADFKGKIIQGESSGVVAEVMETVAQTTTDPDTLIVKYLQEGSDGSSTVQASLRFKSAEEIREVTVGSDGALSVVSNNNEFKVATESTTAKVVGRASIANIREGVVFIRGFFVKVDEQTIVLEKYSGKPSFRVGLNVVENLITSSSDTSLLDNSQGTTNENAPGADRLQFALTLAKYSLTDTTDTNFVELARVNAGVIELEINRPIYGHIEQALARRTFDANGDFVIRQFTSSFREHLIEGFNRGFYESFQGGDESKVVMQISPGKAYVKGFEVTKDGTSNITLNKARTTESLTNANTPARLGNKLRLSGSYGLPEFGDSTTMTSYKPIKLLDTAISTPGTIPDTHIGFARVRCIDEQSSTLNNLYLFDIKMFTKLSFDGDPGVLSNNFRVGDKVTGSVSGATGIVAYQNTSSNFVMVHDVIGTFTTSDVITIKGYGTWSQGSETLSAVRSYNVEDARGVGQEPSTASSADKNFTASIPTDNVKIISGASVLTTGGVLTGTGTAFLNELRPGDIIVDGNGDDQVINTVTDNSNAQTVATSSVSAIANPGAGLIRKRAKLYNQDQSASIFAWPRDYVKTHTGTETTVKIQKEFTVSASGTITLTKESNESFEPQNNDNYQFAIVNATASPSSGRVDGAVFHGDDVTFGTLSGNNQPITIGTSADQGAIIRASYTVSVSNPTAKSKDLREYRALRVSKSDSTAQFYGTAYDHKEISLGVSDIFKIRGIFEAVPGTQQQIVQKV